MEVNVADLTVNGIFVLVIPDKLAVIFADPTSIAVDKPVGEIVAQALLELDHVTLEVISAFELSVYVPIAVSL
jgi:hypothetical protein